MSKLRHTHMFVVYSFLIGLQFQLGLNYRTTFFNPRANRKAKNNASELSTSAPIVQESFAEYPKLSTEQIQGLLNGTISSTADPNEQKPGPGPAASNDQTSSPGPAASSDQTSSPGPAASSDQTSSPGPAASSDQTSSPSPGEAAPNVHTPSPGPAASNVQTSWHGPGDPNDQTPSPGPAAPSEQEGAERLPSLVGHIQIVHKPSTAAPGEQSLGSSLAVPNGQTPITGLAASPGEQAPPVLLPELAGQTQPRLHGTKSSMAAPDEKKPDITPSNVTIRAAEKLTPPPEIRHGPPPGAPLLPGIQLFHQCNPNDAEAKCVNLPGVQCLEHVGGDGNLYACLCDYFHSFTTQRRIDPVTGLPTRREFCHLNVFAPCNVGHSIEEPCGENMQCTLDTLRITLDKFCRCIPGYAPVLNAFGIPAYCEKIIAVEEDEEEEEEVISRSWRDFHANALVVSLCLLLALIK